MGKPAVIICEDDTVYHHLLSRSLGAKFDLTFLQTAEALLSALNEEVRVDAVVLDIGLESQCAGFEVLPEIRKRLPDLPVVIHSGRSDHNSIVTAMRSGATDYVAKCRPENELREQLQFVIASHRKEKKAGRYNAADVQELRGESDAMTALRSTIESVHRAKGNILVTGETGVGKDLVARCLRRTKGGIQEPWLAPKLMRGQRWKQFLFKPTKRRRYGGTLF